MTKDKVFAMLKRENNYISGEKISNILGVSRAAVNTAVKSLRADGCEIESSTNKGYRLKSSPDRLTYGDILAYMPTERMDRVLCFDVIDSTNKKLREMAYDNAMDGQIIIANEQTTGRGRLGRSFSSPRDKGIYLSVLLKPNCKPQESTSLTACASVAVSNAIYNVTGIEPKIKWVNDLVINKKKICGILTEMSVESETGRIQYVIIGIGVNVNETDYDFPDEIRKIASSIYEQTGKMVCRAELAAEIINQLDKMSENWTVKKNEYLEAYRKNSATVGNKVRVISPITEKTGIAQAINDDFSLKVKFDDDTVENVSSGEVSVRGLYGYV